MEFNTKLESKSIDQSVTTTTFRNVLLCHVVYTVFPFTHSQK